MSSKTKGYRIERKIKHLFEENAWKVVRAGGSLGEYDLIAFKNGRCLFMQIKSTSRNKLYYYGYTNDSYESFPFRLVVDFGRGTTRVLPPQRVVGKTDGLDIKEFLVGIGDKELK